MKAEFEKTRSGRPVVLHLMEAELRDLAQSVMNYDLWCKNQGITSAQHAAHMALISACEDLTGKPVFKPSER